MTTAAAPSLSAEHPFPGLRPFNRRDHKFFFGRNDQIFALYRLIDRSRFVAVVGGSGSGKSSLVRAGLLPLLEGETAAGGKPKWRIAEMHPGDAPLRHLADALTSLARDDQEATNSIRRERIELAVRDSTNGIRHSLDEVNSLDETSVLLVVDQFEELFRYGDGRRQSLREETRQRDEANHFVQLLLQARSIPDRDVHIMLTMRSDFIGDCALFPGLPEAVSASQFLVPSLTRDQLEEVIREPIERAKAAIEPALINTLINDSSDKTDHLPVLQHCLLRMWNHSGAELAAKTAPDATAPTRTLTVDHYRDTGRIAEALSRHADEILKDLNGHELAVEQMFRALADVDAEGRAIRRAVKFSQLVAETGIPSAELELALDRYRADDCSFLVPSKSVTPKLTPDTRIDVGHEALLRGWKRVSGVPDAPQDDEPESIKARGWMRAEERDGADYRGLVARIEERALPLRKFDKRLRWWRSRPRTAAWSRRYGGRFEEVEQLFQNTIGKRKRNVRFLAGAAAALILAAVLSGWQVKEMIDGRRIATRKAEEAAHEKHVMHLQSEANAKLADDNFNLVGNSSKLLLEAIHRSLRDESKHMPMETAKQLTEVIENNLGEAKRRPDSGPELIVLEAELAVVSSDIAVTLRDRKKAYDKAAAAKALAFTLTGRKGGGEKSATYRYLHYRSAFRVGDLAATREAQLREYTEAEQVVAQLVEDFPSDNRYKNQLTFVGNKVADILQLQGKPEEALAYFLKVREAAESLAAGRPNSAEAKRQFAVTRQRICKVRTELKPPDFDGALAECDGAIEMQKELVARKLDDTAPTSNLAITHKVKADLLQQRSESDKAQPDDLQQALSEYEASIEIRERFAARDRTDMRWPDALAQAYERYGAALEKLGDTRRAVEAYRKEVANRKTLSDGRPQEEKLRADFLRSEGKLNRKLAELSPPSTDITGSTPQR